jgi:hypothetical protein
MEWLQFILAIQQHPSTLDYSQNTVTQPLQPEESLRSLLPEKLNVRQWQALTQSRQMVWVILGMG